MLSSLRRPLYAVTIAYWALLFVATHVPGSALPDLHVNDKYEHFTAYAMLAALLFATLSVRNKPMRLDIGIVVLLIGLAYGAIDEWLQAIPFIHRDCELADWFADGSGLATAVVIASLVKVWLRRGESMGESPMAR